MSSLLAAFLVLLVSMWLVYVGIRGMINLFLAVVCFWGKVIWKDVGRIEYSFKPGGAALVAFVVGLAGLLWAVIRLAMLA